MSALFGSKAQGPTRINEVQINQSVLGYPLAVVMGKAKIQQAILWVDGFLSRKISAGGGKGFGGGKGGTQYVYSADVIAALCHGAITGIGDVWSGQSWLSNTNTTETYTVAGAGIYTPINASRMTGNHGVAKITAYSLSQMDAGAESPTVLAGSHPVPFQFVAYGTPLSAGKYTINPADNSYHFSGADDGVTVEIGYTFALGTIQRQETVSIPSGHTVAVGGSIPFAADVGVVFEGGPLDGQALARVSGSPGVSQYSVSGSAPATYTFAAGNAGVVVRITYKLNNSAALPAGTSASLTFELFEGTRGQSPAALLAGNFPGMALGYSGIGYVLYAPMDLGYGGQIQQNVFEVITGDAWGGGVVDCNPIRCILRVLTDPTWGITNFPVSAIDNGAGGTWGRDIADGTEQQESTASAWFASNGFFISPTLDRQDTAASVISRWLEAGQCTIFMSEGLAKLVPYGDTSTAGNGSIWLAPTEFAVALDDTCFLVKSEGEEPFKCSIEPWQDAFNVVQVAWRNRAAQYSQEVTPEGDQAAKDRYGERIEDPQTWDFITTLAAAQFAASMRVKRNVYTRCKYTFSLSYRYGYLEPMDIVYVTTSSQWAANANNTNLNIVGLPIRITKVTDNPDGSLDFEAEDYPFGLNAPVRYNKQLASSVAAPNKFADPGNSEVVIFEATNRLTGYRGNQIWIGATGASRDWGGCNIYASMDGDTYRQIGTIESPARLGVLGSDFATGSDPDTSHSLVVNLVPGSAGLESGTTADADLDNTLLYVGGELLSTSTCVLTGSDQYTASGYIRRGRMGSAIDPHSAGGLVLRLDDAVFKYTYDPSWLGRTVHLKFQSFNTFGNSAQSLSSLTAVTFAIQGVGIGTVDASTGVLNNFDSNSLPFNIGFNTGNDCTIESVYDADSGTSTVSGYGPGGAGTDWTFYNGQGSVTFPSFSFTGLNPLAEYAIIYAPLVVFSFIPKIQWLYGYIATQNFSDTLPDHALVVGYIRTPGPEGGINYGGGAIEGNLSGGGRP